MSMDYTSPPPPPEPAIDANRANTRAVVSLILGVVGILANVAGCCCCFSLLLGVCSPVGAFLGYQERKDIEAGRSSPAGQSMATAGMILGLVGTAFLALGLVFHIFNLVRAVVQGGPLWEEIGRRPWSR